ncbi:metallothionein-like [Carcharodon carcharias]|uniref:metallothionein-like n=1 Tax=Carcharodon carcharias TaxID=13397 RepID=UPI001B7F7345|nr:metallothionein-like [Carcharodon carcharias]
MDCKCSRRQLSITFSRAIRDGQQMLALSMVPTCLGRIRKKISWGVLQDDGSCSCENTCRCSDCRCPSSKAGRRRKSCCSCCPAGCTNCANGCVCKGNPSDKCSYCS